MFSWLSPLPSLLQYNGPFKVGTAEYEIATQSLGLDCEEVPIKTIRFRLFYPTLQPESSSYGVSWLPEPRSTHLDAYLRLGRVGPWISALIRAIPWWIQSTMVPAYRDASLHRSEIPLKMLIFSHDLVGGINTNSALLGELASHGIFCVAVEHRDGSAPLTVVRSDGGNQDAIATASLSSVYFKPVSFIVKPDTLEKRDEQLRIRLFELTATFRALELLNTGKSMLNLAADTTFTISKDSLNLQPGSVIWAGHSFGGTTVIQFLKTLFYRESFEVQKSPSLLSLIPLDSLTEQITSSSPLVLLRAPESPGRLETGWYF